MSESTIAAISTPQGSGGISIVRMSGDKSFDIIKRNDTTYAGVITGVDVSPEQSLKQAGIDIIKVYPVEGV